MLFRHLAAKLISDMFILEAVFFSILNADCSFFLVIIVLSIVLNISPLNKVSNKDQGTGEALSGDCATGPSSQVELYCHSATCVDIQWNEMSCLKGPRCYINTDIQQ